MLHRIRFILMLTLITFSIILVPIVKTTQINRDNNNLNERLQKNAISPDINFHLEKSSYQNEKRDLEILNQLLVELASDTTDFYPNEGDIWYKNFRENEIKQLQNKNEQLPEVSEEANSDSIKNEDGKVQIQIKEEPTLQFHANSIEDNDLSIRFNRNFHEELQNILNNNEKNTQISKVQDETITKKNTLSDTMEHKLSKFEQEASENILPEQKEHYNNFENRRQYQNFNKNSIATEKDLKVLKSMLMSKRFTPKDPSEIIKSKARSKRSTNFNNNCTNFNDDNIKDTPLRTTSLITKPNEENEIDTSYNNRKHSPQNFSIKKQIDISPQQTLLELIDELITYQKSYHKGDNEKNKQFTEIIPKEFHNNLVKEIKNLAQNDEILKDYFQENSGTKLKEKKINSNINDADFKKEFQKIDVLLQKILQAIKIKSVEPETSYSGSCIPLPKQLQDFYNDLIEVRKLNMLCKNSNSNPYTSITTSIKPFQNQNLNDLRKIDKFWIKENTSLVKFLFKNYNTLSHKDKKFTRELKNIFLANIKDLIGLEEYFDNLKNIQTQIDENQEPMEMYNGYSRRDVSTNSDNHLTDKFLKLSKKIDDENNIKSNFFI